MSEIRVELDSTQAEPGGLISGRVGWRSDDGGRARVSLVWHTEGKGSEDSETVAQREWRTTGASGKAEFAFRAPAYPWSFSGTLISLIWTVEASLEPRGDLDRVDVVIAPGGREMEL